MILKKLTKLGFFIQVLLLVTSAIILWFPSFIHPSPPVKPGNSGILYILLFDLLINNPVTATAIAFGISLFMSFMLYLLAAINELISRDNLLAAILFMLLLSWNPSFLHLYPLLPAGLFILAAFFPLMRIYGMQDPYRQVFTASMSISLASLFYLPAVFLLPLVWLSFLTYRITGWREWIIVIIGFAIPYLYLFTWLFISDQLSANLQMIISALFPKEFSFQLHETIPMIWLTSSAFMLALMALIHINFIQDKLISIRRRSFLMISYSFLAVLILLFSADPAMNSFPLLYLPLAFFSTTSIMMVKKSRVPELLILVYLLILLVLRYV
jgi:hypothetical protein